MNTRITIDLSRQNEHTDLQVQLAALPTSATPEQALEYLTARLLATMLTPHLQLLLRAAVKQANDQLPHLLNTARQLHAQGACHDRKTTKH